MRLRIGTRGSKLALAQAREAARLIETLGFAAEIVVVKTRGDVYAERPVAGLGKGVFVKEIERALLDGKVDLAVHSAKDMPASLPTGLVVAAYPARQDPADCLVTADGRGLDDLPRGAKVGTASPRRAAQLRDLRGDLRVLPLRGNLDTRLEKLHRGEYDALVVAYSGLLRLGLGHLAVEVFDPGEFLPAPGQGALALETRAGDGVGELLRALDHPPTRAEVEAEKSLLRALGGGCGKAIGAYGRFEGGMIRLKGVVYLDGRRFAAEGTGRDPEELGKWVANRILGSIS